MNDLQKKLDELIALRDVLIDLPAAIKLDKALTIAPISEYETNLHEIAIIYRQETEKNKSDFDITTNELQRLTTENIVNYNTKTKYLVESSIYSMNDVIDKIISDINAVTIELATLTTMEEIHNLCNTIEYKQQFLETYLQKGGVAFTDDAIRLTLVSIKSQCDWHYPALQINPVTKEWVDCMVAADPLYLVSHNLLENIIINYPGEYQRRLRIYEIQDFSSLPQEQFGVIACCNFLNTVNVESINNYLSTFFKLLRSGGALICTLVFSNNDSVTTLVDGEYFNYAIKLIISNLFTEFGYTIVKLSELTISDCSWAHAVLIEARKPGVLLTVKAHQVAGEILEK